MPLKRKPPLNRDIYERSQTKDIDHASRMVRDKIVPLANK